MLLSIDPGVASPGVALFFGGDLIAAAAIKIDKLDACLGERWHRVAEQICTWARLRILARGVGSDITTVVYEKPKVYTWDKAKGDPDDLFGLSAIGAATAGMVRPQAVFTYEPAKWIGQISKVCPVCSDRRSRAKNAFVCKACGNLASGTPRGRYIRAALTEAEAALIPEIHDAWDAVGIGLFSLRRLHPKPHYSNGRD